MSFVAPDGSSRLLRARRQRWTPAELQLEYRLGPGVLARETRSATGSLGLTSAWEVRNAGRVPCILHVVMWTAVPGESVGDSAVAANAHGLHLIRTVTDRKQQSLEVQLDCRLTGATSHAAYRSEASGAAPNFALTPFYDRWPEQGGLLDETDLGGLDQRGLVYAGLHRRLHVTPGRTVRFVASMQVVPHRIMHRVSSSAPAARSRGARRAWDQYVAALPTFRSSHQPFERYWWYRWYGLRLNGIAAGLGQYAEPTVSEGIGYFHQPISYSAMCHAREVRWHHDGALARGVVDTFFNHVAADGALPGRVYLDHLRETDFYHADWGRAIDDVLAVHPDPTWLATVYPSVARYGDWLARTRDREQSGMIDVTDQFETGQEYMSRYEAVDPDADRYGWENRIRLKGIDVTVYAYRLYRFLERGAPDPGERERWRVRAERTRSAVRTHMWDGTLGMFSDVDPIRNRRTSVKAAVCFYPYLTDLADAAHADGMAAHLFNPREFWTAYPVPSSSVDDPRFAPDAEWKGKRHVCPWNGRVWPMTNSHVVDALARTVRWHRPDWAPRLVHLVRRFIQMMSTNAEGLRPNAFEHYHPFTGRASVYRGIDDYQHSWVNDLIVRHVAGVLPGGDRGMVVDPLPFGGVTVLEGLPVAGHRVDVRVRNGDVNVRVDGMRAGRSRVGRPLVIRW